MNILFLLFSLLASFGAIARGGSTSGGSDAGDGLALSDPEPGSDPETGGDTDGTGDTGGNTSGGNTSGGNTSGGQDYAPGPVNFSPEPPAQTGGTGENGGDVAATQLTSGSVQVLSGRVTTLAPEGNDVASVRLVDGPAHGHVSVNPDNTLALVMTQDKSYTGNLSFTYETTHSNGTTTLHKVDATVAKGPLDGWGTSEAHYMLETDANGDVIVEHGENHREVYVSGSNKALTAADIAAIEGIDPASVTGKWLAKNSEYGGSEGKALSLDLAEDLWAEISGQWTTSSNWLLFERGYEYDWDGRIVDARASGESELHPLYIGAWGTGSNPEITSAQKISAPETQNIVFQDIHFSDRMAVLDAQNILFDDVMFTGRPLTLNTVSGITVHDSDFIDIYWEEPPSSQSGDFWEVGGIRTTGLMATGVEGLRIEDSFFNQIGWAPDYKYDLSTEGGQPPHAQSHALYVNDTSSDVTLMDSIVSEGSSTGIKFRPGGFVEGNVIFENNWGIQIEDEAEYTLMLDNVITSASHRTVEDGLGFLTLGIWQGSELTSLVDNIITHLADPNNPDELTWKTKTDEAIDDQTGSSLFYNDTIIWNWEGAVTRSWLTGWQDQNVDGLDQGALDQTTIQLFAAQLLGKPDATVHDLIDYLRTQANGAFDEVVDADLLVNFFQTGFGLAPDIRTEAELHRFIPNDIGDGVRWDNSINWSGGEVPGFVAGDSVDLGGNKVVFGGTETVAEVEFGANGGLIFDHGKLTATAGLETQGGGATVDIDGAGQLWTEGARGDGTLDIDVTGGRFANTGRFQADSDLTASGGQTLLGVDDAVWAVTDGSRLEVDGSDGAIGFDGARGGMSILGLADGGTLAFSADGDGFGTIEEFRSGALGDDVNVRSGADLGGGRLAIDLNGLSGGTNFTLLDVDELIGAFGDIDVAGLGSRNATIVVDYNADAVRLQLSSGNGSVNVSTVGAADAVTAGEEALWNALTAGQGSYDDAAFAADDEDYYFAA